MGIASTAGRLGGSDAIVRALQKCTALAIEKYEEKNPSNKLPEQFKEIIDQFIEMYIGTMIDAILAGKLEKSAARAALQRCFKMAGLADDSSKLECGMALFTVGGTAYNSISNFTKASRVAGIAAASGVGAAPGTILVVAAFTYGVFATYKDFQSMSLACNAGIAKSAERSRRPAAIIDGKGYGVGQVSIGVSKQRGASTSLIAPK